jgi:GT2 family glycosyltransferase
MAVPREAFLILGGFDESFAFAHEDREFGARWADHGFASAWTPGAVVVHRHELSLRSFLRQHFRYGRGTIDFRRARSTAPERKVRFETLRFHLGLVAAPLVRDRGRRSLLLAGLLLSSQAAYLAGVLARAATIWRRPAG